MNLQEFGSWALSQGSVANPQPNYKYKGQCVSLIQQYLYLVFGIAFKAHGNAKDWANNVPGGFTKLNNSVALQRGDILVYGANYGGGYGHVGIIDINGKYLDQNGIKALMVAYRDKPFAGYVCVLRPNNQAKLGLASNNYGTGNYKTNAVMKVRDGAGTNYRQKAKRELTADGQKNALDNGCYKAGTVFTALEIINANDGSVWARGYSGYVCIKDNNKVYCQKV